ncbi:MAG: type III-B CRISPR module RAMP protein Cmr1 [Candidatus Binataceae bacterium]|nr:type III-B CRISPR module RAMP protein Cmr1 [Candidatus Binataceae bacterium]
MSDMDFQPASGVSDAPLSSTQIWYLKALTPVWTGDAERKGERLILTGLLGSLRWWFEVLVRGLGGTACDSSATKCQDRNHCPVCELFGCTGWARKFRFQVLDAQGKTMSGAIAKDAQFQLRFVPLRGIGKGEWALLYLTFCLIADYGAIGGRTVFKPSDESSRANAQHHRDYGLVKLVGKTPTVEHIDRKTLQDYVRPIQWQTVKDDDFAWASLRNFWCVKVKYLACQNGDKSTFNRVIGRKEPKQQAQQLSNNDAVAKWLAGKQQESKKVFSFKEPADAPRTFGFVKPGTVSFDQMKQRLKQAWPDLKDTDFQTGEAILEALFKGETGDSR